MKITLSRDLEVRIRRMMRAGGFSRPEDVVRAAVENLSQQQALSALSVEEVEAIYPNLRTKIAEGMKDARAGRLSDGEEFFKQLEPEEVRPRRSRRKSA